LGVEVVISVKLIKWSLRSAIIVPAIPKQLGLVLFRTWSIKEKDSPWILVALVLIGAKPLDKVQSR
jgi:hypothetical protein